MPATPSQCGPPLPSAFHPASPSSRDAVYLAEDEAAIHEHAKIGG